MKKITVNDLFNATQNEMKKTYKINDRQLEQQIRRHINGASPKEMKEIYQRIYKKS